MDIRAATFALLQRALRRYPRFDGEFLSWEEASRHCRGYNTPEIAERIAAQFKPNGCRALDARTLQILAAFGRVARNAASLRVLDVGGGSGGHYYDIAHYFPGLDLHWTVLETPEMVKAHQRLGALPIQYMSQIPADTWDVILMSGVLQVLPDPYRELSVYATKGRYLLINRLPLLDRDALTLQRATRTDTYPSWFFDEQRFRTTIAKVGRELMRWETGERPLFNGRRVPFWGMLIDTDHHEASQ